MKYRLRLLEPRPVADSRSKFGSPQRDFTDTGVVAWAERVKLTGRSDMTASDLFAAYDAEYNVRDAHPVDSGWRVEELGGHLYNVVNVIPNRERGYKTLKCKRVNQ